MAAETIKGAGALLVPFIAADPEAVAPLHDISQNRATQEHHVLAARRVLDADLEVGEARSVALENAQ